RVSGRIGLGRKDPREGRGAFAAHRLHDRALGTCRTHDGERFRPELGVLTMTQSTTARATDDELMARRIATMLRLGTAVAPVRLVVGASLAYIVPGLSGSVVLAG